MGYIANLILRFLQLTLTILTLGLAGALATQQHTGGTPTRLNFTIFTLSFALLTLLYLLPSSLTPSLRLRFHLPIFTLPLDILNLIFFLSAAIAMSAQMGVHSCTNRVYLRANGITNGGPGEGWWALREKRCREAQAVCAFLWFAVPLWAGSVGMGVVEYFKGRGGLEGGRVRGRQMSQI